VPDNLTTECSLCHVLLSTGTCTHLIDFGDGRVGMKRSTWESLVTDRHLLREKERAEYDAECKAVNRRSAVVPEVELRVLIGVPACGKSTLAERWLDDGEVDAIVSSDGIRKELTGSEENFSKDPDVWDLVRERTEGHLRRGKSVVIDATNLLPEHRKMWLDIAENANVGVLVYRVHAASGLVHRRNDFRQRVVPDDVMDEMWQRWFAFCDTTTLNTEGFWNVIDVNG